MTEFLGRQALEFLVNAYDDRPFCLSISFKAPHGPWIPNTKFGHLYEDVSIPQPASGSRRHFESLPAFIQRSQGRVGWTKRLSTDELYQHTVKQYYRCVTGLDDVVGELVSFLRGRGLYNRTCLLFTSDHGLFLGEHGLGGKWQGYEPSISSPLIIKPIEKPAIRRISAMTLNCDICPTLLELCVRRRMSLIVRSAAP